MNLFTNFVVTICSLLTLSSAQTSTESPTCATITIIISNWNTNETDPTTFEGLVSLADRLEFGAPVWENSDGLVLAYRSDWYISNSDEDEISYPNSNENYPPIDEETTWQHGSLETLTVELICGETYLPSSDPSHTPSYQPSIAPSNIPSNRPSDEPTIIPSGIPSTPPTYLPTYSPTEACNVITLLFRDGTLNSFNATSRRRIRRLMDTNININNNMNNNNNNNDNNNRQLLQTDEEIQEAMYVAINDMILIQTGAEIADRPVWEYSSDDYDSSIYFDDNTNQFALEIDDKVNSETFIWRAQDGDTGKIPSASVFWEREYFLVEEGRTTTHQEAIIVVDCLASLSPTGQPSAIPSSIPSSNPSNSPSGMPTQPSIAPTFAPTEACDEIQLMIVDNNDNNTDIVTDLDGGYVKQNNLINQRPWFQNENKNNIWIEYSNGLWYILNPDEDDNGLNNLYFESSALEPPIDGTSTADSMDGSYWTTNKMLSDNEGYFKWKVSMICQVYTNQPTGTPVEPVVDMTTTDVIIIEDPTTRPEQTAGKSEKDDDTILGMSLVEWFVILFIIFLICVCVIGLWWYRECKKSEILEKEKKQKLTAYKNDDDEEIFGANRRSQAPNSPNEIPNRPMGGSLEMGGGMRYVADGDDDLAQTGPQEDSDAFQDVLAKATKSKNLQQY